jgi:hypothetical protein
MSGGFQRIAQDMQASPRTKGKPEEVDASLNKQSIMDALKDPSTAASTLQKLLRNKAGVPYMLPAYPMAFVIAKDITIRVKSSDSNSSLSKALASQSSSTGGGFLCFSASSASSSKSTSESSYHGSHGEYTYIRIPGPQIIGWMLQLTPSDNSSPYEALDKDILDQMRMGIAQALNPEGAPAHPATDQPAKPVTPVNTDTVPGN